jgi:hypothetical protein
MKSVNNACIHCFVALFFKDFAVKARQQYEIIDKMYRKMEKLYTELSEYFVFDKTKYTLDEFFSDINIFREDFVVSPNKTPLVL